MMGAWLPEQESALRIALACLVAGGLAQALKIAGPLLRGRLDWKRMLESGGMPSSHAAAVAALSATVLAETGFAPLSVAVLVFSLIVVRDAIGVRWLAGEQSKALNHIIESLRKERRLKLGYLKEIAGHTPAQVAAGIALGAAVAAIVGRLA
jgi:acid phosphatase family membrane protein YuiD